MSTNDADRLLTAWLESVAPPREPAHLLDAVLTRTARTSRRPAWRIPERWISMATITTPVAIRGRAPWALAATVALLLLALVAGLLIVTGSQPVQLPAPFGPAANGTVVYERDGELFSVHPDTGATATFLAADGLQLVPTFSNDGTTVAWLEAGDLDAARWVLKVAGADGAGVRSLGELDHPTGFTWSPAGDRIAVASEVGGREAITMVDVSSGTQTVLPADIGISGLAFRPGGGSQVLLRGQEADGTSGLYLADAEGSGPLVRLDLDAGFRDVDNYALDKDYYFLGPVWSPDGTRLAFQTPENSPIEDPGYRVHVAAVDPAGRVTEEITLPTEMAVDDEFEPAWLPDGSGLITHRVDEADHSLVRWDLGERLDAVGPGVRLGTGRIRGNPQDFRLLLSPDGRSVLVWQPGGRGMLVPVSGEPASETGLQFDDRATWQRTAP